MYGFAGCMILLRLAGLRLDVADRSAQRPAPETVVDATDSAREDGRLERLGMPATADFPVCVLQSVVHTEPKSTPAPTRTKCIYTIRPRNLRYFPVGIIRRRVCARMLAYAEQQQGGLARVLVPLYARRGAAHPYCTAVSSCVRALIAPGTEHSMQALRADRLHGPHADPRILRHRPAPPGVAEAGRPWDGANVPVSPGAAVGQSAPAQNAASPRAELAPIYGQLCSPLFRLACRDASVKGSASTKRCVGTNPVYPGILHLPNCAHTIAVC